jgi:hypothetical protein
MKTRLAAFAAAATSLAFSAHGADVLSETFESNSAPGWTLNGLWHVTTNFPASGTYALGFTQNEMSGRTGLAGDYQTGAALDQIARTPLFTVPPGRTVLRFKVIVADEVTSAGGDPDNFDRLSVSVVSGKDATTVAASKPLPEGFTGLIIPEWNGVAAYKIVEVDLSPFAGQEVQIDFRFETLDAQDNNHPGVRIDDLRITTSDLATGDPVSGEPAGTTFASFGVPSINDAGQVAFRASLARTAGARVSAVLAGAPPTVVVREGDAAPGLGNATFTSFRDPMLNEDGRIAFLASAGSSTSSTLGLWSNAGTGGALTLVAAKGTPAPGVAGSTFGNIVSAALPNGLPGPVFVAKLARSTVPGTPAQDGLWAVTTNGTVQLLLRDGENVDTGLSTKRVQAFKVLGVVAGSPGQGRSYNDTKQLAIRIVFTDGTQMVMKKTIP